jgi:hypothetical protein
MKTPNEVRHSAGTDAPMTIIGAAPPGLALHVQSLPPPPEPELMRLPRPGERDPITSSSRQWLIDMDASLPASERFLFRIRRRGYQRGVVFVNVAKLRAFMARSQEADQLEHDSAEHRELVPA